MQKTMVAVVKPGPKAGSEIREVKVPGYGPRDVLVKVKVASICGTDLHIYDWDQWAAGRIKPPLVPGHEFCGNVVAVGDEVTTVKEGDRIHAGEQIAKVGHLIGIQVPSDMLHLELYDKTASGPLTITSSARAIMGKHFVS